MSVSYEHVHIAPQTLLANKLQRVSLEKELEKKLEEITDEQSEQLLYEILCNDDGVGVMKETQLTGVLQDTMLANVFVGDQRMDIRELSSRNGVFADAHRDFEGKAEADIGKPSDEHKTNFDAE